MLNVVDVKAWALSLRIVWPHKYIFRAGSVATESLATS